MLNARTMNQVLVLTDFSVPADNALRYAAQLARALPASLVLLHVRRTSLLDTDRLTGKYPARSVAEAQALLQARCDTVAAQGVACVSQLAAGEVATEFAAAIRVSGAVLAVASKCNTERVPDELVDSTVLSLLRRTPCPLLVVPEAYQQQVLPRQWLVATDGQPVPGATPPAWATALRAGTPLAVRAVLVGDEALATNTDTLALATALGGSGGAEPQVLHGTDPVGALVGLAHQQPESWLVLWARQRSRLGRFFHRSITVGVVLHSQVPVLVLSEVPG